MANECSCYTGFIENAPALSKSRKSKRDVVSFNLVIDNGLCDSQATRIPCIAYGKLVDELLINAHKGSLYCVSGRFENVGVWRSHTTHLPVIRLVLSEIELIHTPVLPGLSVKEVLDYYSPKAILNRYKKKEESIYDNDALMQEKQADFLEEVRESDEDT